MSIRRKPRETERLSERLRRNTEKAWREDQYLGNAGDGVGYYECDEEDDRR
jgi:hypothetical protein